MEHDLLGFVSVVVIAVSLASSLALLLCYGFLLLRTKQNPILVALSPHLEVVACISLADFLICISYIFPIAEDFVLTEELVNDYHNGGWPAYAYVIIPVGTFAAVSSWAWLAILPDAIKWTALSQPGDISPVELIHSMHRKIWPLGIAVALFESLNLFIIKPEPALRLHDLLMAVVGLLSVLIALVKYSQFNTALNDALAASSDDLVPSSSNLGEDEVRMYMGSLLRRALLYMLSFLILWGPVFIFHMSCAIHECDNFSTRIQTVISGFQGFLLVLVFWYQEDIRGLLCRPNMPPEVMDEDVDYYPEYLIPSSSNLQKALLPNAYDTQYSLPDTKRSEMNSASNTATSTSTKSSHGGDDGQVWVLEQDIEEDTRDRNTSR